MILLKIKIKKLLNKFEINKIYKMTNPRTKEVSTASPFCMFLKIRNKAKTKDIHFVRCYKIEVIYLTHLEMKKSFHAKCCPVPLPDLETK